MEDRSRSETRVHAWWLLSKRGLWGLAAAAFRLRRSSDDAHQERLVI